MSLTGEYDVVAEVAVGALNGILGAVHENQAAGFPPMPHRLHLVVDDRPRGVGDPVPAADRTGIASRVEVQVSTPIVSLPVDTIVVRPDVGPVAERHTARRATPPITGIRLPPIRFDERLLTTEVRLRAWVRDATSSRLPEFVHGRLYVTAALARADVAGVGTFVTVDRTSGPLVTFQPAPGSVVTDEQRLAVAAVVRNVIRSDMQPPTFKVSLPPEVRHFDFELQPEARRPCVSLMLMLGQRVPGPGAKASVTPGLLPDGADFAVAVGRDFVLATLRADLFRGIGGEFSYSKFGVSATVRPDWAGASFALEPGRIVFTLAGDGNVSWWGVDDHFTFTVRLAFALQVVDGALELVAVGDPDVDLDDVAVGGGYLEGQARASIRRERDRALAANAGRIREALDLTGPLATLLAGVSPSPSRVALSGVDVRADGVVVHGTIGLAASGPAVVTHVGRAGLHDALDSWIPGGWIDRFVWEQSGWRPGSPPSVQVEEHRFVTPSFSLSVFDRVCLRAEGWRVLAGGGTAPVSRTACSWFSPVLAQVDGMSAERPRPLLPLTEPAEAGDGGGVRVVGHFDPWAPGRVPAKGHAHLLVHVGFDGGGDDVRRFAEAVAGAVGGERGAAVVPLAVVPPGGLAACAAAGVVGRVLVAEDDGGDWCGALGVDGRSPGTVLVGPGGDVVWRGGPVADADELAKVLDGHATAGGEVAVHPIGLAVRVGDRPPDVPLRLPDGSELSLRRLRGRGVVVTFWTSRSAPSLDQLDVLRDLSATLGDSAPLVVAVGDGEPADRVAAVVKERRLPFLVLPDPDHRLSRAFGVWCWPATVWIRPDLRVEAIDLGVARTVPGR